MNLLMKYYKKGKVFVIATIVIFLSYVLFMNNVYTSDHIDLFQNPIQIGSLKDYFSTGRLMSLFIDTFYYGLSKFSIGHLENQWIIQCLLIAFLGLNVTELYEIFQTEKEGEKIDYILILMLLIGFINPFFVESFVYKGAEWGLAIWITILATKAFMQKKIIKTFLLLFVAVSIYQSYVALFMIFYTTVMIIKYMGKVDKNVVYDYLKMIGISLIVAITNIVMMKLALMFGLASGEMKSVRISEDFFGKILEMLESMFNVLINAFAVLPKASILIIFVSIVICLVTCAIIEKKEMKKCLILVIGMLMICLYPFALTFVMRHIYLPPRVIWPIFASMSMCFVILYRYTNYEKIVGIFVSAVFLLLFSSTQTCIMDQYISNSLDKYYMEVVYGEILEYEDETGNEITDVYVIHSVDQKYYHYSEMHYKYMAPMYSHKMQFDTWADVELLNFVSGRNFKDHYVDNDRQEEFFDNIAGFAFNASKQLKFDGNSLYWLIY